MLVATCLQVSIVGIHQAWLDIDIIYLQGRKHTYMRNYSIYNPRAKPRIPAAPATPKTRPPVAAGAPPVEVAPCFALVLAAVEDEAESVFVASLAVWCAVADPMPKSVGAAAATFVRIAPAEETYCLTLEGRALYQAGMVPSASADITDEANAGSVAKDIAQSVGMAVARTDTTEAGMLAKALAAASTFSAATSLLGMARAAAEKNRARILVRNIVG